MSLIERLLLPVSELFLQNGFIAGWDFVEVKNSVSDFGSLTN